MFCCGLLFWWSGSVCDTSLDSWPSVSAECCSSWGQSGGLAGNKPVAIRDKDTSPQPEPEGRGGCGDERSNRSRWIKGERGENRVMMWEKGRDAAHILALSCWTLQTCACGCGDVGA